MEYKVGDKVRIRKDLKNSEVYGGTCPSKSMIGMSGQLVTIARIHPSQRAYNIVEDGWIFYWTDEMFEDVKEKFELECGMVVKTRSGGTYLVIKDIYGGGFFGLKMSEDGKIIGGQCVFQNVEFDTVWQPRINGKWSSILSRCNKDTQVYPKKRTITLDGKTIELSEEAYQEFKKQFAD